MDLLELFGEFKPRQLGSGEIQMQCPFRDKHSTDSQSRRQMFFNPDKNLYHCFSCHSTGTAVRLLTTKFSVNLLDAIELVSFRFLDKELVPYEYVESDPYYIRPYSPDFILAWDDPPLEFCSRGFGVGLLASMKIGLNIVEDEEVITIPLFRDSTLLGIKFRKPGTKEFWYSPGFLRSRFIYHKPPKKDKIIVVESETDTLSSIKNGIDWVGSTLGTACSKEQASQIAEYKNVYLAYDNDDAGYMATEMTYLKLRGKVDNLYFVVYDGEDPGATKAGAWTSAISGAVDYAEYSLMMASIIGSKYLKIQKEAQRLYAK